jgi:2-phospho-L-lactate/phosphoenolpyruvate guanylyltransferase
MRTAAILPVKSFALAKTRLGGSVAETLRARLARAMVADVLLALGETVAISQTIVVTREESVAAAAQRQGALVVNDAAEGGQSAAVGLGVERALSAGIERVLCIPGDCPALDPSELEALLSGAEREPEVVIVPDRHGTGTNGLLLTPPDVIAPSFGPESCERHRALALAAGVSCRLERPPSLLLDIDTGADLAALRQRLSGDRAQASRTRAVLGEPERAEPPSVTSAG